MTDKTPDVIKQVADKITIQFIRNPLTPKSDNWHDTAHEWRYTLPNGQTGAYYTGLGHRESKKFADDRATFNRLQHKTLTESGLKSLLDASLPKKPSGIDILAALSNDEQAANESFNDFCENYGYDSDSIKALGIYQACCESAKKLRGLGLDLNQLAEWAQKL